MLFRIVQWRTVRSISLVTNSFHTIISFLGHGGVTIGSEIAGGVRNIFAEDCFLDSPRLDTAFRIKNNAVRGGTLEDIYIRNMRVGHVARQVITYIEIPLVLDLGIV